MKMVRESFEFEDCKMKQSKIKVTRSSKEVLEWSCTKEVLEWSCASVCVLVNNNSKEKRKYRDTHI